MKKTNVKQIYFLAIALLVSSGHAFTAEKPLQFEAAPIITQEQSRFLAGIVIEADALESLGAMHFAGVDYAVLNVLPDTPDATIRSALTLAQNQNRHIVLQLLSESTKAWSMEKYPSALDPGYLNLAQADLQECYERSTHRILNLASEYPCVLGVSLASSPKFRFEGESVRAGFVEYIRENYPDRQQLNRLWHSHFGTYDEITIWDDDAPDYSYHYRGAYQYEWNHFHQKQIFQYLENWKQDLARIDGIPPLFLTLPATTFSPHDCMVTPNRENLDQFYSLFGTKATLSADVSAYAYTFPALAAELAFMASINPSMPHLISPLELRDLSTLDPEQHKSLIHSIAWESVIAGCDGMALIPDKDNEITKRSQLSLSDAAAKITHLSDTVTAFQDNPATVGILFSYASKIYHTGTPHLESVQAAFEGCYFAGYRVRFITETQCTPEVLESLGVLVLPETPSLPDPAFDAIAAYVENGGTVIRNGTPIPYNEKGASRHKVIRNTENTILFRGKFTSKEYLHALDAAIARGKIAPVPRTINPHGYPLEGVHTEFVEKDGNAYLYINNLRKKPVFAHLTADITGGHDIIAEQEITFPTTLAPMKAMIVRLPPVTAP